MANIPIRTGVYSGIRTEGCKVFRPDGTPLPLHLEVYDHSPTGFEWGFGGSGPAQLALAILVDHLGNVEEARSLYQRFKWRVIAVLPRDKPWTLSPDEIALHISRISLKEGSK